MITLMTIATNFELLLPVGGCVLGFFLLLYLSHRFKWRQKWNNFLYRTMKKWNLG